MKHDVRKLLSVTAIAAVLVLPQTAWAADYTIRASHSEAPESPLHKGYEVFKAYVEGASAGQIEVIISPAGQLGSIKDGLEQVKAGAIQVAQADEQTLDAFYKPMMILATPYLFANDEEANQFLASDLFTETNLKMAEEAGLRMLSAASYGFRNFTNNKHPIKSAADMAGIKMRVPPSPMSLAMVQAMGGSPTPIPWEELYGAMQTGVVDGQENPIGVIHDYSFNEVQKHLTVDNHQLGLNSIVIGEAFFKSLPLELREVVATGAVMASATEYGERNYQSRVVTVDALRDRGMEIYFPSAEEVASFRDAVQQPMQDYLNQELDPAFVTAVYDEIGNIRQQRAAAAQ
ncbi:TRAP transporter substrate-binding protein [Aureimonas fodinaquatilis]|uniref:TRAP transporter substrate-binding protein n=1 Tax=Aureimonas fodinaquatilis TaxID=2565783 RepID=A0A5B0DVR3_9HYPH|nr:TRAP transporter substrate-binding protein [Aureimonas fodinaquatilis]KAA0970438.1 TRAP transporter substrate-binding protein [Aureimonas fodinaquatilis]